MAQRRRDPHRWVRTVTTDATHPPQGLFTKDAATIARTLASKKVSPKGPGSGMRMLTYFINRGGRGLSKTRREELERAKRLLAERVKRERADGKKAPGRALLKTAAERRGSGAPCRAMHSAGTCAACPTS
jgi:tRNA(adenine34) deaminase